MKTAATSLGWRPMARSARSSASSTRSAGCSPSRRVLADPAVEHLDPVHEGGRQQVVLAREVAVDGAHGHVGPGRDVPHLHRLVPAFEPQRHGGVDHALAPGLLRAGERAGQRLLHPDSVSAPSPGSSGAAATTLACHARSQPRASGRRRAARHVRRSGGDHRRPGPRGTGTPDPAAASRRHRRAPDDHVVALGEGHRHRAGRRGRRRRPSTSTSATWSRRSGCWPTGWSRRRPSWPTSWGATGPRTRAGTRRVTVTEGFLTYWEDNRAVFRVVDLATEEGTRSCAASGCGRSTPSPSPWPR